MVIAHATRHGSQDWLTAHGWRSIGAPWGPVLDIMAQHISLSATHSKLTSRVNPSGMEEFNWLRERWRALKKKCFHRAAPNDHQSQQCHYVYKRCINKFIIREFGQGRHSSGDGSNQKIDVQPQPAARENDEESLRISGPWPVPVPVVCA